MGAMPANRYAFGSVPWYSMLIVSAIVIGLFLCGHEQKRLKLPADLAIDLALCLIPSAIVGARLYYVAFSWDVFAADPLRILRIWEGGLAIYGGILGGAIALLLFCAVRHMPLLQLADVLVPALALGQGIGRWGNYFNMEAYGRLITNPQWQFFPAAVLIAVERTTAGSLHAHVRHRARGHRGAADGQPVFRQHSHQPDCQHHARGGRADLAADWHIRAEKSAERGITMPTTPAKNLLYRAALPILAPHSREQMTHHISGHPLTTLPNYERILAKHHVFGASLLLQDGANCALCDTSTAKPEHLAQENTRYRVASITKMATALVTLRCVDDGLFSLDSEAASLLPDGEKAPALSGVTVRHLLCHTSGLRDLPILDDCLKEGKPYTELLRQPEIRACAPGQQLIYSNFGFGLLGCILEQQTGLCIEPLFQEMLFRPLHMHATLDASMLNEAEIMPITRVLPYRAGQELRVTALGRHPLQKPNPLCHYGHTAGAMYTDGRSVLQMLTLIHQRGTMDETRLIGESLMQEMTRRQSATPTRTYGLGLVILNRPEISPRQLLGHQGFAYGCVDGAFIEEDTGRAVVFLNGGASEARTGRLGLVNRDVLQWALKQEMPSWT